MEVKGWVDEKFRLAFALACLLPVLDGAILHLNNMHLSVRMLPNINPKQKG
ncbi:MAG: hypothetical protein FWG66_10035 [Spirochaetes bacterium]|nr:hypothetical protein [Spirochaetota bacterium]